MSLGLLVVLLLVLPLLSVLMLSSKAKEASRALHPVYLEGVKLKEAKDYQGAEARFREMIRLDPGFVKSYLRLLEIYQENHAVQPRLEILKTLLDDFQGAFEPDDYDRLREEYGHLNFDNKIYGEAMISFLLLLSRGTQERPAVLSRLVYLYCSQGMFEKALGLFERIPPQMREADTRFSAALAHYGARQYDMARNLLLDLIADRQETSFHYYLLAKCLAEMSDHDGSINYFKVYLQKQSESSDFTLDSIRAIMRSFYQRTRYHSPSESKVWEDLFGRMLQDPGLNEAQKRELTWQRAMFGYFSQVGSDFKKAIAPLLIQVDADPAFKDISSLAPVLSEEKQEDLVGVNSVRDYYNSQRLCEPFLFDAKHKIEPTEFYRVQPIDIAQIESAVDDSFIGGLKEFLLGKGKLTTRDFSSLGSRQIQLHVTRFFRSIGFDECKLLRTDRSELYFAYQLSSRSKEQVYARFYPDVTQIGEVEMNQLHAEMVNKRYDSCLVLTMGTFTSEASGFGIKHAIRMISGAEFNDAYLIRLNANP